MRAWGLSRLLVCQLVEGVWRGQRALRSPYLSQIDQRVGRSSLSGECVTGLGGLDLLLGAGLVELHELGQVELGLLEDLDLLDEDVLKREDLGALFSDLA